jgi:hypothetical protein
MAMMDDLVKHVSQHTGIPQEQARAAIHSALDFADQRLPGPIAAQVRSALGGGAGGGGNGLPNLGDIPGLGGLFGGKH